MTVAWSRSLVPVLVLALPACVPDPPPESATNVQDTGANAGSETAGFKKEPRMNGRGEVGSISLEKVFELQQSGKALIFDARPSFFYSLGHIPGAISLPRNGCDAAIAKRESEIKAALAEGKTIIVYCTSLTCPDARTVARHISGFGYPASIFSGGWDTWKDSGLPTE